MKVGIVSPPTVVDFGPELALTAGIRALADHVPVGALTLVAILREAGVDVEFVDLNTIYYEHLARGRTDALVDVAAERILACDLDLVGLGTLCSSYPLTLRLAAALRRRKPERPVLLGGPQPSAVAGPTLTEIDAVDLILRGEADESIVALVRALERGEPLDGVGGLSWRAAGAVRHNVAAAVPLDLDALPLPDYHRFAAIREVETLPLEVGRGCPYGCTFCSTNVYFRRRFRMKSPRRVVEQMAVLESRYGVRDFDFVHDMLTVVRSDVVELCEAILAAGRPFRWNASARTDRVDAELLELMRDAGCRGIFFGIETGSKTLQRLIKKRLDLTEARQCLGEAASRDMEVVVSLITGFPDEQWDDLRDTVGFFVESLRFRRASPQLHLLAPLPGSPLHATHRDRLRFDDIQSDISHSGWAQDEDDRSMIAEHPEVFPNFYSVPTPIDRALAKELRSFLVEAAGAFRWLLLAIHRSTHALDVFVDFRSFLGGDRAADLGAYYRSERFRLDFFRFVRARKSFGSAHVASLLAVCEASRRAGATPATPRARGRRGSPRRAPGVALARVSVDVDLLTAALAEGTDLARVPERAGGVVAVRLVDGVPSLAALPPIAARVMRRCDGRHDLDRLAEELAQDAAALGVSARDLCATALDALRAAGLVGS